MMNEYRIAGDAIHLVAFLILLGKLWVYKSSAGVSGKTQLLYTLVFCTRYVDLLLYNYISAYNTAFKVIYLCLSYAILASIYLRFYKTYEKDSDSFRIEFLIFPALVLAFIYNYKMEPIEIMWTFSEYLECFAAWPQFYMIMNTKKVKLGVFLYLLALGVYRILYIQNWISKYYSFGYYDAISDISGTVQVIPYLAFWIMCLIRVVKITSEKQSWFVQNLAENDIFTIKVSKEGTAPLLTDAVKDGWHA